MEESTSASFFGRSKLLSWGVVISLFISGIGLRMINVTNPPLDFHAWRQLRAATIARGFFYQWSPEADPQLRDQAIELASHFEILEPRIFERIVALTYLLIGQEILWVARLYAILFWAIGGVGVYLLAKQMTSIDGAVVALAAYLFIPYGVVASRSFQPDPLMVMWVIWSAYAIYRWSETRTWRWAIFAGFCSGMAILIKVFAVYPVVMAVMWVLLSTEPLRKTIKDAQAWVVAALMVIIPAMYYILQVGNLAGGYLSSWVGAFSNLLFQPWFYIRWLNFLHSLFDLTLVLTGLVAVFLLPKRARALMIGLWMGYFLIGLSVPSLIITHDYYNLVIIPIIALSLAPIGHLFLNKLIIQPKIWQILFVSIAVVGLTLAGWLKRNDFVSQDYHEEIKGWIKIGRELPKDGSIIGISQDYDTRLQYYSWRFISPWPTAIDQQMNVLAGGNSNMSDPVWKQIFIDKTKGYRYFLVTNFAELDQQPVLKEILSGYRYKDEPGYRLYDLQQEQP
jgi:4-amino-4-deoxy-L-arabinose transferase-like glycosyltransferase